MSESVEILLTIAFSLVILLLTLSFSHYIVQRTKAKWTHGRGVQVDQFEARIAAIETRIADVQDIVISIDDQLKRTTSRPDNQPALEN